MGRIQRYIFTFYQKVLYFKKNIRRKVYDVFSNYNDECSGGPVLCGVL